MTNDHKVKVVECVNVPEVAVTVIVDELTDGTGVLFPPPQLIAPNINNRTPIANGIALASRWRRVRMKRPLSGAINSVSMIAGVHRGP